MKDKGQEVWDLAPDREKLALGEIERLADHPWAGFYRSGTSGDALQFVIAPDAGYTFYLASSCGTGTGWLSAGSFAGYDGSVLSLKIEVTHDWGHKDGGGNTWCRVEKLYLVPWDDLLFAVPDWYMNAFCAQVSDGTTMPWAPFRYDGDDDRFDHRRAWLPAGYPQVPPAFERRILREPIVGRIVFLERWEAGKGRAANQSYFVVDIGSEHGLSVEMTFFAAESERPFRRGEVVRVGPTTSLVRLPTRPTEDLIGLEVSTRHPATVD